jgi:hypothetical protein
MAEIVQGMLIRLLRPGAVLRQGTSRCYRPAALCVSGRHINDSRWVRVHNQKGDRVNAATAAHTHLAIEMRHATLHQ